MAGQPRRASQAASQARRVATLFSQRAMPESENEKAIATQRQAEADVQGRKADLGVGEARPNMGKFL